MKIDVVGFVNERRSIFAPLLVKGIIFTFMITLAMVLFYGTERWAGIVIYAKEVIEFSLLIFYLKRRRIK